MTMAHLVNTSAFWIIAAIVGGIALVLLGFFEALRKPSKKEAERIKRIDQDMIRGTSDDPSDPARFVP